MLMYGRKPTQYCKAIIFQLKISKFKSIYAQDLGEEESTGLEVAMCQTLCQALNIFPLLSHEHCAKSLQNPTAQKRKLRIQERNQFPHSQGNTNVLSYQHTLVSQANPSIALRRSAPLSSRTSPTAECLASCFQVTIEGLGINSLKVLCHCLCILKPPSLFLRSSSGEEGLASTLLCTRHHS